MLQDTVGYLGPKGTFTEAATLTFQSDEQYLRPYGSNSATLVGVNQGEVQWGVVPVENSVQGSVTATLDTIWQMRSDGIYVNQEILLPIHHYLLSQANVLGDIRRVYAHPQALAQCQQWLSQNLPEAEQISAASNTSALTLVAGDSGAAAISSKRAAEVYQLPTMADKINDYTSNCTRFWVMSRTPSIGGDYTSLAFCVPANVPGALLAPLKVFSDAELNMTRIESRPTKKVIGDYVFFVDLEHKGKGDRMKQVLNELKHHIADLSVFGSYTLNNLMGPVDTP